jgi:hypothetical protein
MGDYLEIGCENKLMTAVRARSETREGMNSEEEEKDKMRQSTIDVHKVNTIPWIDTGVRIRSDQIRYQLPSYCMTPVISFLTLTLYYNRSTSNPYLSYPNTLPNPNIYSSTKNCLCTVCTTKMDHLNLESERTSISEQPALHRGVRI